jgi:hypothetical protein
VQTGFGDDAGPSTPAAPRATWWALLAVVCCGLTGCADAVRTASQTAVPIVVSSGLGELATPQSQAQLKAIAASPAVQEAGYGVGLGIGRGILDEGTAFLGGSGSHADEPPPAVGVAAPGGTATANAPTTRAAGARPAGPATAPATASATTTPASTQPSGAAKGMAFLQSNIGPVVGDVMRVAVTEGMRQGVGLEGRAEIRAAAETAGEGFMTGVTRSAERDTVPMLDRMLRDRLDPALDAAVHRRLGTALHDVLQEQVAPVVRQLVADCARDTLKMPVQPDNSPDVIANALNVSKGAGMGTHAALTDMGFLKPSGEWSTRLRLTLWGGVVLVALIGLATLVLLSLRIAITWSQWRQGRRAKA